MERSLVIRVAPGAFVLALAVGAQAQPLDATAADRLFREARDLMQAGKPLEACPKLEESYRLDPAPGTLLNLASCQEATGRIATAWRTFVQTAEFARRVGDERRAAIASERAAALEPRLPRLAVKGAPDSATISIDGAAQARELAGTAVPVDPGSHDVTVTDARGATWSTTVSVASRETRAVEVPGRFASPRPREPPPPPVAAEVTTPAPRRRAGRGRLRSAATITAAGLGTAGLAVGGFFALRARSSWNQAEPLCPDNACDDRGYQLAQSAHRDADRATVFTVSGLALIAAAAAIWFWPSSDRSDTATARVEPSLAPGGGGIRVAVPF